ncbi:MAG TPA: hypothetical protein PL131_04160 [Methylotenera sp.]|nr:hypothetical protein [Methylotenera sp.]HPH05047.1 hypothetical protein [Methylotenera sp.]HPN00309.1 hypothetical protein [Methylotenera sp.]
MRKALWLMWLAMVWFFSLVAHSAVFAQFSLQGIIALLGGLWLIYLAGLWFEQTRITDTAWAMLLGYAIGMIRLLDLLPNQQQYANWLKYVPKFLVASVALLFIFIFIGLLPLIAKNIITSYKTKNRVLGRDF